ncbi:hypothetical protein UYSO10_0270 [Kosakonia radicincitans]|nr:hypothetical protein UYSO10_0270 [Kosakonia radicincitans]
MKRTFLCNKRQCLHQRTEVQQKLRALSDILAAQWHYY